MDGEMGPQALILKSMLLRIRQQLVAMQEGFLLLLAQD